MLENMNLAELDDVKSVAKELLKLLKDKGIKQSDLLEAFAKASGAADWNTFVGLDKKEKDKSNQEQAWTERYYVHIDNGGFFFTYNKVTKSLHIDNGFYGYSLNKISIKMTKKELQKLINTLNVYYDLLYRAGDTPSGDFFNDLMSFKYSGSGYEIEEASLVFTNTNSNLEIGLSKSMFGMVAALENIAKLVS